MFRQLSIVPHSSSALMIIKTFTYDNTIDRKPLTSSFNDGRVHLSYCCL